MRRRVLALAVAAASLVAAGPLLTGPAASAPAAMNLRPLLGIVGEWSDARLVHVDRRSLEPLNGPTLEVFGAAGAWAFSPDRSRLALATACQADGVGLGTLQLVDVRAVRSVGCFAISFVGAVAWPTPNRLLAITNAPAEVLLIDAGAQRIIERTPLEGLALAASARAGQTLVALAGRFSRGTRRQVRPERLVVADGRGGVRSVGLDGVPPSGLVVDPRGRHAYLVAAGAVVRVDLGSLAVEHLRRSSPQRRQGSVARTLPNAVWLGRGIIASFGSDVVIRGRSARTLPLGLRLIDIRSRRVRMLNESVSSATLVGDVLLATGFSNTGLVAYDSHGRKRYQLFRGRRVAVLETLDGRAYVQVAGKRALRVVDVRSGRVAGLRPPPFPLLLFKP
jgi:hypothetical protein